MKNLFPFEYVESPLFNADGTPSKFRQVFGLKGETISCPKASYHMVKTMDISSLGHAFLDKGHEVNTFNHKNGEIIGLNVGFGAKKSKVGDSTYELYITVPNNGTGRGSLSIKQHRLICDNGMVSSKTMHKDNNIKIPHTVNYKDSIELMKSSILGFTSLLNQVQSKDEFFNKQKLKQTEVMFHLNKWFFEQELPKSQIKDWTLDSFRHALAMTPEIVPSLHRYNELKDAFNREMSYNRELGLELSLYTAYASITNYLSRRVEDSGSKASKEIKFSRVSQKLSYFESLV